jgi:hypothetical protein
LVEYDVEKLRRTQSNVNGWFSRNFTAKIGRWNFYYLYAFERFAYFREEAEGKFGGVMANWYDQGVDLIKSQLSYQGNGDTKLASLPSGIVAEVDPATTTALGVLFLVRSTEILALGNQKARLKGGKDLPGGDLELRGSRLVGDQIVKDANDLMKLIDNPTTDEDDLKNLAAAFKTIILSGDENSKAKQRAWMRGLVTHQNFGPRYVGVRFLANNREMASCPALIYAVSDPNLDIALMAHNGLRFISRKIDSISLPPNPKAEDFLEAKEKWERWYLSVEPDGDLLDK